MHSCLWTGFFNCYFIYGLNFPQDDILKNNNSLLVYHNLKIIHPSHLKLEGKEAFGFFPKLYEFNNLVFISNISDASEGGETVIQITKNQRQNSSRVHFPLNSFS